MVPIVGRQFAILVLWIALSLIVIIAFLWVLQSTRKPREFEEVQESGYRLRRGWGWLYGTLLIISFAATAWTMPYAWAQRQEAKSPAITVEVVAHQFSFTMPASLPARRLIKFVVTSSDVNHGFGIYSPKGVLLAQVQAMPDYKNVLYFTFPGPGTYIIRCLEYCGEGHSVMYQKLTVYSDGSPAAAALKKEA